MSPEVTEGEPHSKSRFAADHTAFPGYSMFEQERALRPFKPAMDVLMEDTHFGTIYDADQLPCKRPKALFRRAQSALPAEQTR